MNGMLSLSLILTIIRLCLSVSEDVSKADCTGASLNGVWSGGRCFFIPKSTVNFTTAWALCKDTYPDAVLAQIHTTKEANAITENMKGAGILWVWVALTHGENHGSCSFSPTVTNWCDTAMQTNPNLSGGKTWIRSHPCDDIPILDEQLGGVGVMGQAAQFFDQLTTAKWNPLCQITNCGRTYTHNPEKCLLGTPAESFKATYGLQECTDKCSLRTWCRSYEYDTVKTQCKLFPWSLADSSCSGNACAEFVLNEIEECYHYDSEL